MGIELQVTDWGYIILLGATLYVALTRKANNFIEPTVIKKTKQKTVQYDSMYEKRKHVYQQSVQKVNFIFNTIRHYRIL